MALQSHFTHSVTATLPTTVENGIETHNCGTPKSQPAEEHETDPNDDIVFIRRLTAAWKPEGIQRRKAQYRAENLETGGPPLRDPS